MTASPLPELVAVAAAFLQESVYASRAASHAFSPRALDGASGCGLGLRPAIPEDFSPRQAELLERMTALLGVEPSAMPYGELRKRAAEYIKIQDGLDRQRNHFIKDFRTEHGFERAAWAEPVAAQFKTGIDAINAENRARLDALARALVAALV